MATDADVPPERVRTTQSGLMMGRISNHIQGWLMTQEERAAQEELRVLFRHMAYRRGTGTRGGGERHLIIAQEGSGSIDSDTAYVTA